MGQPLPLTAEGRVEAAERLTEQYRDAWIAEIKQREIAEDKLRQIRKLSKAAA